MRSLVLLTVVVAAALGGENAPTIAKWETKPFLPKKPGQKLPPPAYYATTAAMPLGAAVTIKVVQCPKNCRVSVRQFIGGPVFAFRYREFVRPAAGDVLTCKLDKKMRIAITTQVDEDLGACKGVEHKDGSDVLRYAMGDQGEVILEVKVLAK